MELERTIKLKFETEEEAKEQLEHYRQEAKGHYILKKATYEYKTKKAKGEVIAEAYVLTITQVFGNLWEME